jgi:hypothetical protein
MPSTVSSAFGSLWFSSFVQWPRVISTRLSLCYFNLQGQSCLLSLPIHRLYVWNVSGENIYLVGIFLPVTFPHEFYTSQALWGQVMCAERFSIVKRAVLLLFRWSVHLWSQRFKAYITELRWTPGLLSPSTQWPKRSPLCVGHLTHFALSLCKVFFFSYSSHLKKRKVDRAGLGSCNRWQHLTFYYILLARQKGWERFSEPWVDGSIITPEYIPITTNSSS